MITSILDLFKLELKFDFENNVPLEAMSPNKKAAHNLSCGLLFCLELGPTYFNLKEPFFIFALITLGAL